MASPSSSRLSFWSIALVLFSGLAAAAAADEESSTAEAKEHVLNLDNSNFHDVVQKHDFIVVEFYAPWCGHCKKLAPEYEKAASILNSHDPPIVLAKVDASEESNRDIATEFEIRGFPTIKILRNGGKLVQEYKGPRETDGIVDYLKKQRGPPSVEINSIEEASNLISDKKIAIVGVFPKFSGEEFENYTALADKLRSDYDFGHTLDAKLLPRGDSSVSGPIIRVFKPFDERVADFQDFHVDAAENFVETSSIPLVILFSSDPSNHPYVMKFFNNQNAKAMLFLNMSEEAADSFTSKYREVAEQYKGQTISFLLGDLEASEGAFQYFGIKREQVPVILIQAKDGQKYLKPNVEPDQIAPWVKQYKDNSLQPYKKSQPVPEANNEPVKVVVADTLQDMVINSGKNVLLEFYAPWCGHCKQLAPILDEVAVSYERDPDVVIAKLDSTENDFPRDTFDVKGYPTVYFRSASGKLVQYEGDRTKLDIIDFIEKNRDKSTKQESVKEEL